MLDFWLVFKMKANFTRIIRKYEFLVLISRQNAFPDKLLYCRWHEAIYSFENVEKDDLYVDTGEMNAKERKKNVDYLIKNSFPFGEALGSE